MSNDVTKIVSDNAWLEMLRLKAIEYGMTEEDLDASKVAGYFSAINLENFKNGVNMAIMGERERNISTALRRDSLVKHGSDMQYDVGFATPAYASFLVLLDILEMKEKATYVSDSNGERWIYTLAKENPIYIESTPFSLYYDIEITLIENITPSANVEPYWVSARYVTANGYINPLDDTDVLNKPINTTKTVFEDTGLDAFGLFLPVRQYKRSLKECRYIQNTGTEIHVISFENQLAEFSIEYRDTDYGVGRLISKQQSFTRGSIDNETIYYRYPDDDSIQLINKLIGNFKPAVNSIIRVEVLETLGKAGVFIYSGNNISITMNEDDSVHAACILVDQPVNGADIMSVDGMRKKLISISSSRDSILNDGDLKAAYADSGVYKAFKLKHNFFGLTFCVVAALKNDKYNFYYPTNTLNLFYLIGEENIVDDRYIILSNDQYTSTEYGIAINKEMTEEDVTNYKYFIPFSMVYDKETGAVSVYDKVYSRVYPLTLAYRKVDEEMTIIANKLRLNKAPLGRPSLKLYVTSSKPLDADTVLGYWDKDKFQYIDTKEMVVRCTFSHSGLLIGYKDFDISNYNPDDGYYELDMVDFMEETPYGNKIDMMLKNEFGEDIVIQAPVDEVYCTLEIYMVSATERQTTYKDLLEYKLINRYTSEAVTLYKNISYVNNLKTVLHTEDQLEIRNVPVVASSAYYADYDTIHTYIEREVDRVEAIWNKAAQNHEICLRFANTHGFAKRYRIGTDLAYDLDRLHLSLRFKVKMKKNHTTTTDEMRTFINNQIMAIDFKNGDYLHISIIAEALKDAYTDIAFIEYDGMNDTIPAVYQYVGLDLSQSDINTSIPEIINVNHIYSEILSTFVPEIYIDIL